MQTQKYLFLICKLVLVISACIPLVANAGSFKVNPLRLTFAPDTKSSALEVSNTSENKITVQVDTKVWTQLDSGADQYADTKDIIFFPKIVTLAAGEKRIVRVSYRGEKVKSQERAYRIFVQELIDRSRDTTALNFALRFSIPVFITPRNAAAKVDLSGAELKDDKIQLVVKNKGNAHSLIQNIQMTGLDEKRKELFFREEKGWYVLSGSTNVFQISLSPKECRNVTTLEFAARSLGKTYVTRLDKDSLPCP